MLNLLLLSALTAAFAAVPFQLPADENPAPWVRPLDLGGFSVGYAGGAGVWARVVPVSAELWVVEVRDESGELRRSPPQPRPHTVAEREKLAALAHSLTRPDGELPPLRVAAPPPVRRAPPAPAPEPAPTPAPAEPPPVPLFSEGTRDRMGSLAGPTDPRIDGFLPRDLSELCICSFYLSGGDSERRERTYLFNEGCTCDSPDAPQEDEPLRLPGGTWP